MSVLKYLIILVIIIATAAGDCLQLPRPSKHSQDSALSQSPKANANSQPPAEHGPIGWQTAFEPPTWSNWALVVVGFLTSAAALLTLLAIRKQAVIMQKQTDATQKSVELFANAERARITVEVSRLGNFSLEFKAKNIGRTTARIIDSACFSCSFDRGERLPETPEYVTAGANMEMEATDALAPGESFPLTRQSERAQEVGFQPFLIADLSAQATRNNLASHGSVIWIYGRIRYYDGISPEAREYRFCFKILSDADNNTWAQLGGPLAYRLDS